MEISQILNSPSFDILLGFKTAQQTPEYARRLAELTDHVLASGVFAPGTVGRWHLGRHEQEEDREEYVRASEESGKCCANARRRIVDFVERLTAHAVAGIMAEVAEYDDPREIKADKVGAWLMNEVATMWDDVCGIERPVGWLICLLTCASTNSPIVSAR